MTAASRALQKYFRQVDAANARLAERWGKVTGHLKFGLSSPIATSAMLYHRFAPPSHYVALDGKQHRKPVRALYGFGQAAQEHFDLDMGTYNAFAAGQRESIDRDNAAVGHWLGRAQSGDAEGVSWYCRTVLPTALPQTPPGAPTQYLVTGYSREERHLVVERLMPSLDVIPELYRYEIPRNLSLHQVPVGDRERRSY